MSDRAPTPPVTLMAIEDTTGIRMRVEELQKRLRDQNRDIRHHDGRIDTLQEQVARLDERMKMVARVLWWGFTAAGGALVTGFAAVLAKLYGGH